MTPYFSVGVWAQPVSRMGLVRPVSLGTAALVGKRIISLFFVAVFTQNSITGFVIVLIYQTVLGVSMGVDYSTLGGERPPAAPLGNGEGALQPESGRTIGRADTKEK